MVDKHDIPTSSLDISQAPPKDANLTGTAPKAIIKNVDMSEEMQQDSVDIASAALEKYNIEKDIAAQIKKEFDRKHGPTWHVVVGKNFGSYVTHETKHFIYFYVGTLAILIWKSWDPFDGSQAGSLISEEAWRSSDLVDCIKNTFL